MAKRPKKKNGRECSEKKSSKRRRTFFGGSTFQTSFLSVSERSTKSVFFFFPSGKLTAAVYRGWRPYYVARVQCAPHSMLSFSKYDCCHSPFHIGLTGTRSSQAEKRTRAALLNTVLRANYFPPCAFASSPTTKDGSTQVMTQAVHPFEAFHEVHFKLDWTPTPKMKKEQQTGGDGRER